MIKSNQKLSEAKRNMTVAVENIKSDKSRSLENIFVSQKTR